MPLAREHHGDEHRELLHAECDGQAADGRLRRSLARVSWDVRMRACVQLCVRRPMRALAMCIAPLCVPYAALVPRVFAYSHNSLRA